LYEISIHNLIEPPGTNEVYFKLKFNTIIMIYIAEMISLYQNYSNKLYVITSNFFNLR
jgi:hypothetical protein